MFIFPRFFYFSLAIPSRHDKRYHSRNMIILRRVKGNGNTSEIPWLSLWIAVENRRDRPRKINSELTLTSRLSTIGSCGRRGGGHARDSEAERERERALSPCRCTVSRATCIAPHAAGGLSTLRLTAYTRVCLSPRARVS